MTSATNPSPRTPTGSMVWICGRCCRWILCRSWGIPPPCALVALQGGAGVVFGAQKKDVLKILEESPILWMVYYGLPQKTSCFVVFKPFSWCKTNSDQLWTQISTTISLSLGRFISRSNLSGLGDRDFSFIRNGLICDFSKLSWFLYIRNHQIRSFESTESTGFDWFDWFRARLLNPNAGDFFVAEVYASHRSLRSWNSEGHSIGGVPGMCDQADIGPWWVGTFDKRNLESFDILNDRIARVEEANLSVFEISLAYHCWPFACAACNMSLELTMGWFWRGLIRLIPNLMGGQQK